MNYDASKVGVPYCRASRITINYPDNNQQPSVTIEQALAVKLADGSVRQPEALQPISATLDFSKRTEPVPLVDVETGADIGQNTNLGEVFMAVLAFVRKEQVKQN